VQKNAQIISSKARAKGKHERGTTLFLLEEGTASAAISSAKKRRGGETARGGAGRDEPTAREYLEREREGRLAVFSYDLSSVWRINLQCCCCLYIAIAVKDGVISKKPIFVNVRPREFKREKE